MSQNKHEQGSYTKSRGREIVWIAISANHNKRMVCTQITVEVSPSSLAACRKCHCRIPVNTLRFKHKEYGKPKRWYHMSCFRPLKPGPLNSDLDVVVYGNWNEEQLNELRQWVQAWNQQYVSTVEKIPAQYLAQAVQTSSTPLRRLLLEVFQYLYTREVELLVGLTCKAWFHVSRDSEYWKTRFMQEFQPATTKADTCYRAQYLACFKGSCWSCHKFLPLAEIELMCPVHKRPLCSSCKDKPECQLIELNRLLYWHRISPSLPKYLNIPVFKVKGIKVVYKETALASFIFYANHRRNQLLNLLTEKYEETISPAIIERIRTFDTETRYRRETESFTVKLSRFLGRNAAKELFEATVHSFVCGITSSQRSRPQ